jgi:putative redox protein
MRVVARRIEGMAHEVDLEGGHVLILDEPPDRGGTDTGPRPTQLLAASLAGCTAITVEMYADRKAGTSARSSATSRSPTRATCRCGSTSP